MVPMEPLPTMPPPPIQEYCYRHPSVATGVHCTRCGRPICTECMIAAPVGHQCPECVAQARTEFRKGPGRRIMVANAKGMSATKALLGILLVVFVIEVMVGGAGSFMSGPNNDQLVKLGASVAVWPTTSGYIGIALGEYWRLFTSMFLHIGLLHIAFNAYALWIFGTMVEGFLGRWKFVLLYLLTGVCASAVSYAWSPVLVQGGIYFSVPSAGASGAIFGVFGVFLAYAWKRRQTPVGAAQLRLALTLIVINAVIGFTGGIDWHAHLGGLVAGAFAGWAVEGFGNARKERSGFVIACVVLAVLTVGLVVWKTAQIHTQFPGIFAAP
jgi:membrane associated rhomboid family serine protease